MIPTNVAEWIERPVKPLFGNTDVTIDDKNRLQIPADLRRAMDPEADGSAFYVVPGTNEKPWLWPERLYEKMAAAAFSNEFAPEEDDQAYIEMNFGMAFRVELDKQGRILLPDKWMKKQDLGREVTIVGKFDHAEIWPRAVWAAREEELLSRRKEIAFRVKQRQETEKAADAREPKRPSTDG